MMILHHLSNIRFGFEQEHFSYKTGLRGKQQVVAKKNYIHLIRKGTKKANIFAAKQDWIILANNYGEVFYLLKRITKS